MVDVAAISKLVGSPENLAEGQRISDASVTLVRDNGKLLPLRDERPDKNLLVLYRRVETWHGLAVVILCDNLRADDGRMLERQIRERAPEARVMYVDPRVAAVRSDAVLKVVAQAQQVVVAVYVVPSAARTRTVARGQKNSASLPDSTAALLDHILTRAPAKTAVLAMGTPYLTEDFPGIETYICTFSNATVSEISAVRALFGEIPIPGHLPVSIPGAFLSSARKQQASGVPHVGSSYTYSQGTNWFVRATQYP
jgi:beta-N-acetylhexosaminidase